MTVESRGDPIRRGRWAMGPTFAGKKLNRHSLQVSNSVTLGDSVTKSNRMEFSVHTAVFGGLAAYVYRERLALRVR
jgi:hypothetical protein